MGTRAVYHCNQGFQMQPGQEPSAECLQEGQWSNSNQPPQCVGECVQCCGPTGSFGDPFISISQLWRDSFASQLHQVLFDVPSHDVLVSHLY